MYRLPLAVGRSIAHWGVEVAETNSAPSRLLLLPRRLRALSLNMPFLATIVACNLLGARGPASVPRYARELVKFDVLFAALISQTECFGFIRFLLGLALFTSRLAGFFARRGD